MTERPRRVVISGHDLKFIHPLIDRLSSSPGFEVKTSLHPDHGMADTTDAEKHLRWADSVFCEWAMGNAVWFSKNKRPGQTLVVRLHLQEVQARLPFLWKINWQTVDHLVCICHHTYDWLCMEFPVLRDKAIVIYNPINAATDFSLPRMPHSEFNLGFVGMVPKRKRLDIAFDIFSALRDQDDRFTLHVKGRKPAEYPWMLNRRKEMKWYDRLESKIGSSPHRNAVVFDPHGPDMPAWYSAVGFILSTSDFEGSHQAVAEGMAAGCIPVIRNWEGADRVYPGRFQFSSTDEALEIVNEFHTAENYSRIVGECREYAKSKFDSSLILGQLECLLKAYDSRRAELPKAVTETNPGIAILGFVQPGSRNGYRIRVEQVIKQYRRFTDNLTFILLHQADSQARLESHVEEFTSLGCRVYPVEFPDFFSLNLKVKKILPAVIEIEKIIAEHNVTVLQAEALYCMRVAGVLARRCSNVFFVFDHHGISPEETALGGGHAKRVRVLETLEQAALKSADLNVFVSKKMAEHYAEKYDVGSYESTILPCCVENKFFDRGDMADGLDIPPDRFVIVYAGSLAVWQCGKEMLGLYSKLYERNPRLFFLLLTPGHEHETAHAEIKRLGIPPSAYMVAEIAHDQIPLALRQANLGLLLRRHETVNRVASPTKFAEYLAAGVPVLMTDNIGDYSAECETKRLGLVVSPAEILDGEVPDESMNRIESFALEIDNSKQNWADHCSNHARDNLGWDSCMVRLAKRIRETKNVIDLTQTHIDQPACETKIG